MMRRGGRIGVAAGAAASLAGPSTGQPRSGARRGRGCRRGFRWRGVSLGEAIGALGRPLGMASGDVGDPQLEERAGVRVASAQLNARARPWIWGRPPPKPRSYRRRFIYTL